jgi:hypothetical protein
MTFISLHLKKRSMLYDYDTTVKNLAKANRLGTSRINLIKDNDALTN